MSIDKNFYCYFMWFIAPAKNQVSFWYLMTICQFDKFFIMNKNTDFVDRATNHNIEKDYNVIVH